ncbi:MAG TPA: type I-C CRISPR-associated protein Cas7/Csd2 [Armatimonadetes bacterium]|jgi:CRISPR-associated protein Csd2|nr:type I-C CRISPR-associated protein Cas7/Csd2 [Armatimonadota bacterium]
MSDRIYTNPELRHDFVLLFDVTDGNPNGDPDAGNLPRVDPETMQGLVTDVCLKRKVRNYVALTASGEEGYRIYVNDGGIALNTLHEEAYAAEGLKSTGSKQKKEDVDVARARMCRTFYDVRLFGAVMTTNVNCGQVRGPVQLTFARSISPVTPLDLSITRVAITKPEDSQFVEGEGEGGGKGGKVTEMGRKPFVPYGLYRAHGFCSAPLAKKTGVTPADLALFWEALCNMWEHDRSASRGFMACRGLYIFTHDDALGKAAAQDLFARVAVRRRDEAAAPRFFEDYIVKVADSDLPEGVALTRLVG